LDADVGLDVGWDEDEAAALKAETAALRAALGLSDGDGS
jgi:hypothetical protein